MSEFTNTTGSINSGVTTNVTPPQPVDREREIIESFVNEMVNDWKYKARVAPWTFGSLITLYALMILFGASGNLLVILVVIRNRAMRTARNVFIVNLAVSDLMLCLITMPLTLVEILYQTWQFGDYPAACPVAALLQATSLFVSTLSITAIALDRRKLIVYPHEAPYSTNFILTLVPIIWMCAIGLSSPMAIWKKLEYWTAWADHISLMSENETEKYNCSEIISSQDSADDPNRVNCLLADIIPKYLGELQSCKEDFPKHGRIIFSSISMVIQYLLPTLTIAVAYCQIYAQLKMRLDQKKNQLSLAVPSGDELRKRRQSMPAVCVNRMNLSTTTTTNSRRTSNVSHVVVRLEQDISRMRRTIHLLISVGMVFCICWMPLNILNTVLDITEKSRVEGKQHESSLTNEQLCIIFAICHAIGMLSACANPIIYGFLNENFHREFIDIFKNVRKGLEYVVCYQALRNSLTENNDTSALDNGDVANATIHHHSHKDVSLTMKYHLLRCCRKKKSRSIECHDDDDDEDDDTAGNNNNIPLRQLNHNQHSVASGAVALDVPPTIKLNGIKGTDEESSRLLSGNEMECNNEEDIISLKDNVISQGTPENCEESFIVQKIDDTVELISDKNSHKISVLITPSPNIKPSPKPNES